MDRIDIKISFACNNLCEFCVQGDKRHRLKSKTFSEIKLALDQAKQEGISGVVFTGGEPTIYPKIIEVVNYAHKLGFKSIQLQSNGRLFAYLDFCKKIIAAGATEFSPALHSSKPNIHDRLTRSPGAWQQVVLGINNLRSLDQYVLTNTVINSLNYKDLPDLAKLLVKLDVNQFQFAYVHIIGTAWQNKDWLIPKKSDIMPFVKNGLDIGIKADKKVMTEAIPYCLMTGYEQYIAENSIPTTKVVAENIMEDYEFYRKNSGKQKNENCQKCKYFNICEGPWKEYPEIYGWDEFMPVSDIQDDFKEMNLDTNLVLKIQELYSFNDFKNSYKFIGHSCGDVHLLLFGNQKIIFKKYKYNNNKQLNDIIKEKKLISVLSDFVPLQNLIENKNKLPYFIFSDKIIKLYEYIEGQKTDLYSCKEIFFDFLKFFIYDDRVFQFNQDFKKDDILNEVTKMISETKDYLLSEAKNINITNYIKAYNEQFDKIIGFSEQIFVPYNNFEIIKDLNNLAIIETEHILENFYPINYCLAKYIVDLINESTANDLFDIDLLLQEISQNINYIFSEADNKQIKFLFLNELIYRMMKIKKYNDQTIIKFWNYFKSVNDKLY